ncbi:MAG: sigma-70 region 4 domain-containing protein [Muribaculaceae bacterium]|nr:sigma-70 region 4 domain-containing protein [Muribaculaceae bacterium]
MALSPGIYDEALNLFRNTDLKRVDICRQLNIDYDAFTYFLKSRHPELIKKQNPRKNSDYARNARKVTERTYRKAVKMAEETDLTYKEIAEKTDVSLSGLKTFIRKHRRDLLMRRQGVDLTGRVTNHVRLRKQETGQTIMGHEKYKEAVEACDNEEYIELTVTEIAKKFGVPATGLLAQLRDHFPEISERRQRERERRGLADNRSRGPRQKSVEKYAAAVEMLRDTDMTIEEVANECDVPFPGFRNFILSYHKDIVALRRARKTNLP